MVLWAASFMPTTVLEKRELITEELFRLFTIL